MRSILAASALTLLSFGTVSAAVHEPFDYTLGAQITGQNGGTNWANAWSDQLSNPVHGTIAAGLSFSNLDASGNALSIVYDGATAPTVPIRSTLGLPDTNAGGETAVVWMSYLIRHQSSDRSQPVRIGEGPGGATWGLLSTNTNFDGAGTYNGVGTQAGSPAGQTMLVLMEMRVTGVPNGSLDAWMLTEAQFATFKAGGLTAGELNSASVGAGSSDVFARLSQSLNMAAAPNYGTFFIASGPSGDGLLATLYDEIRISTVDLDDVTPLAEVPEPASLGLLAIGGVMALRRRRGV